MVSAIAEQSTAYKAKCLANYCQKIEGSPQWQWQKELNVLARRFYDQGVRQNPKLETDVEAKLEIMRITLHEKFTQSAEARELLLATGQEILEEDSPYDKFWGISDGQGSNFLGKLLMSLRKDLAN